MPRPFSIISNSVIRDGKTFFPDYIVKKIYNNILIMTVDLFNNFYDNKLDPKYVEIIIYDHSFENALEKCNDNIDIILKKIYVFERDFVSSYREYSNLVNTIYRITYEPSTILNDINYNNISGTFRVKKIITFPELYKTQSSIKNEGQKIMIKAFESCNSNPLLPPPDITPLNLSISSTNQDNTKKNKSFFPRSLFSSQYYNVSNANSFNLPEYNEPDKITFFIVKHVRVQ